MKKWIFAAVLLLGIILFPMLSSNPIFKPIVLRALKTHLNADVQAGDLQLSWLGPQQFRKLSIQNENISIDVDVLKINASLFSLFFSKHIEKMSGDVIIQNGALHAVNAAVHFPEAALSFHEGLLDINISGTSTYEQKPGDFHLNISVQSQENQIALKKMSSLFHDFPTALFTEFCKMESLPIPDELATISGPTFSLDATTDRRNDATELDIVFQSTNINLELHGNIFEDRLTLREPIVASLEMTPEINCAIATLLSLNTVEKNEGVIHLTIGKENFVCPINNHWLSLIEFEKGHIEIGKIYSHNEGALSTVMSLIKKKKCSEMEIWLTPLFFRMDHETLHFQRVDALLDEQVHICFWGDVDMAHQKLEMIIGLPSETLKTFLGIQKLPDDYVLPIAIKGTMQNPHFTTKGAAAKIAAFIASQNTKALWLTQGLRELFNEKAPPPEAPFPWNETITQP